MLKLNFNLFVVFFAVLFFSCKKNDSINNIVPPPNNLGVFSATVSNRMATTATVTWNASVNTNNADTVKYKVYINNNIVATNLLTQSFNITNLIAASAYQGRVLAYTNSGDTASASFSIDSFATSVPNYNYVTGFYRVTETSKVLNTSQISNYVFYAQVILTNDSTIQFVQNRRNPRTWWAADFSTQIYPMMGDSLIGGGITPRGRILNPNTIRMGYLYGSSVVYNVNQLWEKLSNPADTSTITYTYPNVSNMITTVAGSNTSGSGSGSSGDGGLATNATLLNPTDVVADNNRNIYLNDGGTTFSIRKVDANGVITRFAGNNTSGFSGDGGQAASAQLNYPQGLAIDNIGNLYISDMGNRVIRKVNTSGVISTIAGIPGSFGYSGDGGPATSAQLGAPSGIAVDAAGNIYFSDPGKHVIRKINTSGIITTIAGTGNTSGYSGDGGLATAAKLYGPNDICLDAQGNLYIADRDNHCIRKVNTSGIISTIAGIGGFLNYGFTGDGGAATSAKLNKPQSVSVDNLGSLYISDYTNNRIRKVNTSGIISTIAGNGQSAVLGDGPAFYGGDYGVATSASVGALYGNFWINNFLYVAASYRIRKIKL
jgi:sugar lactone lactonase YvrE